LKPEGSESEASKRKRESGVAHSQKAIRTDLFVIANAVTTETVTRTGFRKHVIAFRYFNSATDQGHGHGPVVASLIRSSSQSRSLFPNANRLHHLMSTEKYRDFIAMHFL
jgi:flagellar basal body rod protein FlgC